MKFFHLLLLLILLSAPQLAQSQGLPRASPESQGIASSDILDFIETADREIDSMNGIVIVRNGHVVTEGWWTPYDAESPHLLYSLTKSFTSSAVGMLIDDGKLNLHDKVLDFFPEYAPEEPSTNLKNMRVHDLIRMATGHQNEVSLYSSDEPWAKSFLAHPVPHIPGTHFVYNTPSTYMLSAIVQRVSGMTTEDYLTPRLFKPLGIKNPLWQKSPQGESIGGTGLSLVTEDLAKLGQLYLQKGRWNDRQILSEEWVDAATSLQISNGSNPDSDWHQGYGYQFWQSRFNTYRGDGAFGQYCIVIPEHNTVIAINSGVGNMQSVLDLVFEKLLPALRAAPIPESADDHEKLRTSLASLEVNTIEGKSRSDLATKVNGKVFSLDSNDLGIESLSFDFADDSSRLTMQLPEGESAIEIGSSEWKRSQTTFTNDNRRLSYLAEHAIAASGAWTADDVYSIKLVYFETPFYTTMNFQFDGEKVFLAIHGHLTGRPNPRIEGRVN